MARAQLDVSFYDETFLEDPYSVYEQIRAVGTVVWNDLLQGWMVVGYDEAVEVVTDSGDRFGMLNGDPEMVPWFEAPNMITVDGDLHRRLRGALAPLFTRSAVAKWEPRIAEVVEQLLAPLLRGDDSFDLIADFTNVPTIIVADMLGVPPERHEDFQRWSHTIVTGLSYGLEDEARRSSLAQASKELNEYFAEEIERHRRDQRDDLITAMLHLAGDDAMSDEEIRSTGILLLIAGYDTTAKTMGNTLIALERHPDQRRRVAENPSLLPAAIEEALRWFGPVQWNPRGVMCDTELDGTPLKAGEHVFVFSAAANRDPRRWEHPERYDVSRELKSHMAFGYGPHLCLGAPLARLETKVAIGQLLRLAPEYRLRDIDFGGSQFIRGPERGVVEVGARVA